MTPFATSTAPDAGTSHVTARVAVPGADATLLYERDEPTGSLRSIRAGDRVYVAVSPDGRYVFDDGFVTFRESRRPDGFDRDVSTPHGAWRERYRWGADGKLVEVDGVRVHRDDRGRVVALVDADGSGAVWSYAYDDRGLAAVDSPAARRTLGRDRHGRVRAVVEGGLTHTLRYDADGRRKGTDPPTGRYHRDEAGRVWTVTRPDGSIESVFLWDGHRCLARIDGPPGAPLAAVFSLDPSATPVRVTTRAGAVRVPRDAYGEALLGLDRVPGLFGGVVAGGLVHLPLRALDPRTGSFCAPDPMHGGADDARRGARGSYTGPLPAEPDAWSPYAVCRDDPVGRGDPTGGISGWLVFSDLTWSLQNNLLSFFGIDWWFNLFSSLFTGFQLGDFWSSEGLTSSDRLGAFAVRRGGIMTPITDSRAFTTQHIVWAPASEFEELQQAYVVDPKGRYEPTLYGTVLRGRPEGELPFLIRGMASAGGGFRDPRDWTRQGGPAAPVCPGAVAPWFPAGGFHFESRDPLTILAPRACPLDELEPTGRVAVGALEQRATMLIPLDGPAPAVDDLVLLSDAEDDLLITRVASSSQQGERRLLRFDEDAPGVGPAGVTLTLLQDPAVSSESRTAEPAVADAFTAVGATGTYAAGDLLRTTVGADVTALRVARLEARLPLDRPLPAGMTGPIQVRRATVSPAGQSVPVVGSDRLDFSAGTTPVAPSMGLVRGGGQAIPVRVLDASDPASVQVDTDISGAGGGPVDFFPVTAGAAIGRRPEAAEPESRITYRPDSPGVAPDGSSGTVVLRFEGAGGPAVRRVTGAADYDAVVLDRTPAGAGPWTVERFVRRTGTSDVTGREINASASLVVEPGEAVDGAAALRLDRVSAAATPGVPDVSGSLYGSFTISGDRATGSSNPASQPGSPRPGQVVAVTGLGPNTAAVVRRVRVTPVLDRTLPATGGGIQAVRLGSSGPEYQAERLAANRLLVRGSARTGAPTGTAPAPAVPVAFPRFGVGETVEVLWGAAPDRDLFRIAAVSGTTITLDGGGALPTGMTDVRVRRMVPMDPGTGSHLLARDGEAGASPTDRITFSVWQPNAFPEDRTVGIVQGDRTWPAVVTSAAQDVAVEFTADTGLSGTGGLGALAVQESRFIGRFLRDGDAILLLDDTAGLASAPGELVLVTPFIDSGNTAAAAELSGGTLLVPNDEAVEIDRRQSLTDHELTHTLQYSIWGPLWFCYFPMLVLELPLELATDVERPTYGPFFAGTLTAATDGWELALANGGDPDVAEGRTLQVVKGADIVSMVVREVDAGTIRLRPKNGGSSAPSGAVQARLRNDTGPWATPLFDTFQFLTHGGLLNSVVGTTWGLVLWALGKAFWGLGRAIAGTGDHYPGTVDDLERRIIRLTTPEGPSGLAEATEVIVRQGEVSVVRSASLEQELLSLEEPLTFSGDVQVAPYASLDPDNAFAWFPQHPGTVPDPANPFRIEVPGHGGDFSERDRIEIAYRDGSFRTYVLAVDGDTLEIEDRVSVVADETSLRVARVGAGDPMGQADSYLATELGMGWMRWLFDPWGRIDVAVGPDPLWLNIVLRSVRYLIGTQMWSLAPPAFGYVFWGRFFVAEHLARIEQEASGESGDLYTPLSRVTGDVRRTDDYGRYEMVVGDIARFRNWTIDRAASLVATGHQQEPGIHRAARLRLVVDRATTAATSPATEPNGTVETGGTDPGAALYDRFTDKSGTAPNAVRAGITNPLGFEASDLGHIPDAATTIRHVGCYAAFTRPGSHRLTVPNGVDGTGNSQQAREAQERERQTIFFDVDVGDVVVRVNGVDVPDGAAIQLVHTQEAVVSVAPDGVDPGARRYRVTVTRPEDGPVLRTRNHRRLVAQAADGVGEPVEVCRFYAYDAGSDSYADPSLSASGVHLGGDLYVPVRRFTVDVVSTLPLRPSADPAAAAISALDQGAEAVLLVPTGVTGPVRVTEFDGRAPAATDPALDASRIDDPGDAARAFIGTTGSALRLRFASDPELSGPVPVVVSVPVGTPGGLTSTLTVSFQLRPA